MEPGQFVEPSFKIPEKLETNEFRLRMLTINDAVKDYDAVMSSVDALQAIRPHSDRPVGLTLAQNLIDCGWHQREFQTRHSFAYTVVSLDESRVLGCVYFYPTRKRGHDAEVYLWARETRLGSGLDASLGVVVKRWLNSDWPFKNPAMPGRDIDWSTWNAIPDEKR